MNSNGMIAGRLPSKRVGIVGPDGMIVGSTAGLGYEPVWSPDNRWVFYADRTCGRRSG